MKFCRFPMMTPAQLADLLLNPLAQSHMELLVENIRIAMAYHKNQVSFYLCLLRGDPTGW